MGAFIFAKHANNPKEYIFEVDMRCDNVEKGDYVIVSTMKGKAAARATSDLVECRNSDEVALKYGAYMPLGPVLKVIKRDDAKMIFEAFSMLKFDDSEKPAVEPPEDFLPY